MSDRNDYGKLINLVHLGVVAPGLWALSYRPQWLRFTPYVAGIVATVHGYQLWNRTHRLEQRKLNL